VKTYVGVEVNSTIFLTSTLERNVLIESRPERFAIWVKALGSHRIRRCINSSIYMDAIEFRKISWPCWETNQGGPAPTVCYYVN
jgi:hypothetical protein